jgi:carbonic anhydrase/acetyltransferase-like protein (isoleucine patch superfamily)
MAEPKYEITEEQQDYYGKTLYRIRALKDFELEHAEVLDCPCEVKKGELGGWVATEGNLSQFSNCWIGGNAKVFENAKVSGHGYIGDKAIVRNNATVKDSLVMEEAEVFGNAAISGEEVHILGCSLVGGNVGIRGRVIVEGESFITGDADIEGEDIWIQSSTVADKAYLRGGVLVWESQIYGNADVQGEIGNYFNIELTLPDVQIAGNAVIKSRNDFIRIDPFQVALIAVESSREQPTVPVIRACDLLEDRADSLDKNYVNGATIYTKGNGWLRTDTASVTFYKTSNPEVIGLTAHTGVSRDYTVGKDVIITDPVFLAAINFAAVKFGILQNEFKLTE